MFLTREEESILAGEQGRGRQRAMELLVAVGKILRGREARPHNLGASLRCFL